MRDSRASCSAVWTFLFAAVLGLGVPAPIVAETVVSLAPFRSLTLHGGGKVVLRHGSPQRVTFLEGSIDHTGVTIDDEGRLSIDRCQGRCPERYELVIEIVTPEILDLRVADGGTIQTLGGFPRQAELGVAVDDGGTIDLRSMTVDVVSASVRDGGRIFTKPQKTLVASIARGGAVTYWGSPRLKSSVEQGGVVARGAAADVDKPLTELGPAELVLPLPPVPPVPPVPTLRGGGTQ